MRWWYWCTCGARYSGPDRCRVRISESTAHAYTSAVIDLLADTRTGPAEDSARADPDFVLLDGTLAECDRVGDGRADFSTSTAGMG